MDLSFRFYFVILGDFIFILFSYKHSPPFRRTQQKGTEVSLYTFIILTYRRNACIQNRKFEFVSIHHKQNFFVFFLLSNGKSSNKIMETQAKKKHEKSYMKDTFMMVNRCRICIRYKNIDYLNERALRMRLMWCLECLSTKCIQKNLNPLKYLHLLSHMLRFTHIRTQTSTSNGRPYYPQSI